MGRFLYYIPGRPGVNAALLRELGLVDRFELSRGVAMTTMIAAVPIGPDGKHGCIIAAGERPGEYAADRQRWIEGPGYWVGLEEPAPLPEELAREIGISGVRVTLADMKEWRVPVLHLWDEDRCEHVANLPKAMTPVAGGRCEVRVREEYREADELARGIFAAFVDGRTLSAEEAFRTAVRVLAVNYRIGEPEAGLLGIFGEADLPRVLAIAIDAGAIQRQTEALSTNGQEWVEPVIQDEEGT